MKSKRKEDHVAGHQKVKELMKMRMIRWKENQVANLNRLSGSQSNHPRKMSRS